MGKLKGSRRPPAPKKPPLTHFLCLPLVTEQSKSQLERSLETFRDAETWMDQDGQPGLRGDGEGKNEVKGHQEIPMLHPKAIRPVGALHCTLGVMSLNHDQLSQATAFLEELDVSSLLDEVVRETQATTQQATSSEPLKVDLKGLESMHAPEKTSILYSPPSDESGRLYPFCLAVQQLFKDKGFLVEDDRTLKLHATIVNTIYAKGKRLPLRRSGHTSASTPSISASGAELSVINASKVAQQDDSSSHGHGPNANAPLKLDARPLLDRYREFVWAENVVLDRLAICEMGAKKLTDSGGKVTAERYTEVASIALPV